MSHEIKHAVLMAKQPSVTLIIDDMCELNFRHCATSRKVWVRLPMVSLGFFFDLIPSGLTEALGSTRSLTEMSTDLLPGIKSAGA
jgi:hypothetical protein